MELKFKNDVKMHIHLGEKDIYQLFKSDIIVTNTSKGEIFTVKPYEDDQSCIITISIDLDVLKKLSFLVNYLDNRQKNEPGF